MCGRILLFESKDLCYESDRFFMECLQEAFENAGYEAQICDLTARMEEKLLAVLKRREQYLFAMDFNSVLPRVLLDDDRPFLEAFGIPFFNYLVDHPLYHHAALRQGFPNYFILCIDRCHRDYIKRYYPHIRDAFCLPLGAARAGMERGFWQKRLDLLFLGTYEPEEKLYLELDEYPADQRKEISALIECMEADDSLTQEEALLRILSAHGETLSPPEFAQRMNGTHLADRYLRNANRRKAVLAAAKAGVPFTVAGCGWDVLEELLQPHITVLDGIGYAASIQLLANAKMLLNTTPGFHGGFHDRVYSAMMNHVLCFTEGSAFAREMQKNGWETVPYSLRSPDGIAEAIQTWHQNPERMMELTARAYETADCYATWQARAGQILDIYHNLQLFGIKCNNISDMV